MKAHNPLQACFFLVASGLSVTVFADSIMPEEPEAYEPFAILEIEIGPPARPLPMTKPMAC